MASRQLLIKLAHFLEGRSDSVAWALEQFEEYPEDYNLLEIERAFASIGFYRCKGCNVLLQYDALVGEQYYCSECY